MAVNEKIDLTSVIPEFPQVKLVYLFGSIARGDEGPASDYDLAFYVDEKDRVKLNDLKLDLLGRISLQVKSDRVDIVIINLVKSPELKYQIIKEGRLLYEEEPYRVLIEPRILNEYFDFHSQLVRHDLTRA